MRLIGLHITSELQYHHPRCSGGDLKQFSESFVAMASGDEAETPREEPTRQVEKP